MKLVEALDQAIASRGLRHLTLAPTTDGAWQASFRDAQPDSGYSVAISVDPECALIGALTGDNNPDARPPRDQLDLDLIG